MSMFQSSLECAKDGFITIIGILVISPASRFSGEELKARLLSDTRVISVWANSDQ